MRQINRALSLRCAENSIFGAAAQIMTTSSSKVKGVRRTRGRGIAIEKNREEKNGIKRPSIGGKCRAIWDALDRLNKEVQFPTAKDARLLSDKYGWEPMTCLLQLYAWRKFNGLKKR